MSHKLAVYLKVKHMAGKHNQQTHAGKRGSGGGSKGKGSGSDFKSAVSNIAADKGYEIIHGPASDTKMTIRIGKFSTNKRLDRSVDYTFEALPEGGIKVSGVGRNIAQILNTTVNSLEQAVDAAEQHQKLGGSPKFLSGAAWRKKYPETLTLEQYYPKS